MKKKRNFLTLIEVMVVIVLIGLITGVLAYNMRGSLHKGKIFKTEQGGGRVYKILTLELAEGRNIDNVESEWTTWVMESPLASNGEELCKDGWGQPYTVELEEGDIAVRSAQYTTYLHAKYPGRDDRLK